MHTELMKVKIVILKVTFSTMKTIPKCCREYSPLWTETWPLRIKIRTIK